MSEPLRAATKVAAEYPRDTPLPEASARPSPAQRRYLSRGLDQPGGKLPLFDAEGQRIDRKTIESCLERGWAEPWFDNPVKPGWLVCKLTPAGRLALGEAAAS